MSYMGTKKKTILPIIVGVISILLLIFILIKIIQYYPLTNLCSIMNPDVMDDAWLDCANARSFLWIHLFEFTVLLVEIIGVFMWKKWAFGFGIFSYGILILTNIPKPQFLLPSICLILLIISKKEFIGEKSVKKL